MCPELTAQASSPAQLVAHTRAMATDISIRVILPPVAPARAHAGLSAALAVFGEVAAQCTRFDPASPLMRANAEPGAWHTVPHWCFGALTEAWSAYRRTGGLFDPRVLSDLVRLGYDRSLPFAAGEVRTGTAMPGPGRAGQWQPDFRPERRQVLLQAPVDLGGIGKGLAVRWAAERLAGSASNFLVEAGGDCYCAGVSADGGPWQVGVEDPGPAGGILAVLAVSDLAVTTSSIRLRHWRSGERTVHHLIDPRTGEPGGQGLLAVTVAAADPAWAEVTSKTLFLHGAAGVAAEAERLGVAALWVTTSGTLGASPAAEGLLAWRR